MKETHLNYGIHWFRRDLRLTGNLSLKKNLQKHQGRVLGVFCFDSVFLSRKDFSHHRFAFFLKTLGALQNEMQEMGGDLLVLDENPLQFFKKLNLYTKNPPTTVSFNRDYEPFARDRDEKIQKILSKINVSILTERDHLLIEPHEILKDDGTFYQIYTPFSRKWFETLRKKNVLDRLNEKELGLSYYQKKLESKIFKLKWTDVATQQFKVIDQLNYFIQQNKAHVHIPIPEAGARVAFEKLEDFKFKINEYGENRDYPSIDGTSGFSIFLKNGSITTAQIISYLKLHEVNFKSDTGKVKFLKELIWREFYYSLLWHEPRIENEAFNLKYRDLKWENDPAKFQAWCNGETGYPIIDAGMRQLKQTGWMHNRLRMIVASFLTKDLLIDWRWGENHFMKELLDGDLAPNNGGWQWAASTGCDAQPYFRIFNPELQSQRFDAEAEYIKKWVPELNELSNKEIHQLASKEIKNNLFRKLNYPSPIVIHADQKNKVLALFKKT